MPATAVTLSCEQCRRRKTKCDKKSPCSACQLSGITCTSIQRPRLARGRHARAKHNEDEINSRISQLEDLVRSFETRVQEQTGIWLESDNALPPVPVRANDLFAKDFFSALSQQVGGIREALADDASDGSDDDSPPADPPKTTPPSGSNGDASIGSVLFSAGTPSSNGSTDQFQVPSEPARAILIDIFSRRIDPVFKMVFIPGMTAAFRSRYAPEGPTDAVVKLVTFTPLERAVYFLSVCVMSESEVKVMLRDDKEKLIARFQKGLEDSMIQFGVLNNPDKLVIEAFVLYLLGMRLLKQYTLCWTLLPVAMRIASAIGLPLPDQPDDNQNPTTQLRDELHGRIWLCVGILDYLTARDRGTPYLMTSKQLLRKCRPVNDSDCEALQQGRTQKLMIRRAGVSDTSLLYVLTEAMQCSRQLAEAPEDLTGDWTSWNEKLGIVESFKVAMRSHCVGFEKSPDPYTRLVAACAETLILEMKLLLRRPAFRFTSNPIPPWDQFDVLQCTTDIMERGLLIIHDSSFAQWAWFFEAWPKWHILAALLGELCIPRNDALADRAYSVAKQGFEVCAATMATSDLSPIFRSIKKLMRRVEGSRSFMMNPGSSQPSAGREFSGSEPSSSMSGIPTASDSTGLQPMNAIDGGEPWLDVDMLGQLSMDPAEPWTEQNGLSSNDALWANWDTFLQETGNTWDTDMTVQSIMTDVRKF